MTASRGFNSFGMRADLERRGLLPAAEPEETPVPAEVPAPPPKGGTLEILITPVIDEEALVAVTDRIAEAVRAAFQRGVAEGIADAESALDEHGQ